MNENKPQKSVQALMASNPSMPKAETAHLIEAYRDARIILEYGSGGSTKIGSQMPGKYIMSVESDRDWARELRSEIAASDPKSPVSVYHVDIGATAAWGRVVDESGWRQYHRYPNAIWDEPFFRHPDLILIDGRFRVACLMTALLRIQRPVRVLFDDYVDRPKYQCAECIVRPQRLIGRMAEFHLEPGMTKPSDMGFIISQYFQVTVHGQGRKAYDLTEQDLAALNREAFERQERQNS